MIQTPVCPLCSQPPVFVLDGGHQAWCGTDGCPGLTWDMHVDLDTLITNANAVEIQKPDHPD
jgi:hypothetical protein